MNEQLWPDLGKEVGGRQAGHNPVGLAAAPRLRLAVVLRPLLRLEDRLDKAVDNLLAGKDQLFGRLLDDLGRVVLVLLGPEQGLQQLLEPLKAGLATADHHVGDVVRLCHQQMVLRLCPPAGRVVDRDKPHVLKDLHDKFPDAFLVADAADHFDADGGNAWIVGKFDANVFENFDDAFAHTHTNVHDPVGEHLVVLVDQLGPVEDELADKVNSRLAHHCRLIEEAVADAALHIVTTQNRGILVDHRGQALERL